MDIATILGLVLGIGALLGSFLMEGGHLGALIQLPAMLLVILGTFGATIITTSMSQVKALPEIIKIAAFEKRLNPQQLIELIYELAQKARKNGLLSLEKDLASIREPFLKKALQLAIDGFETNKIKEILEIEMSYVEERHKSGAAFFQKLGGFSPTLGIMGTVLGLIHALGESGKQLKYRVFDRRQHSLRRCGALPWPTSYIFPSADKLKAKHQDEGLCLEIITEGVMSLAMGDNPRVIRMKLLSFLIPGMRQEED